MPEASGSEELARLTGTADQVRRVFEALPVMAFGVEGPEFRYTAVNAAFRAALDRGEVIGTPLADAFADLVGQQIVQLYQQVYDTGQPLVLHDYRAHLRPEGSAAEIEKYFDVVMVPVRAADGTVTGLAGTANDVTDTVRRRQAAEAEAGAAQRRYEQARDVIGALQRELLPAGVPVLPAVQIAASYRLADADTAAGGDWFDALPLPGGRVALVVGDVVGHGVAASAVMGQLRVVLHERLAATGRPARRDPGDRPRRPRPPRRPRRHRVRRRARPGQRRAGLLHGRPSAAAAGLPRRRAALPARLRLGAAGRGRRLRRVHRAARPGRPAAAVHRRDPGTPGPRPGRRHRRAGPGRGRRRGRPGAARPRLHRRAGRHPDPRAAHPDHRAQRRHHAAGGPAGGRAAPR